MAGLAFLRSKALLSLSIEGASLRLLACRGHKVVAWSITPVNPRFLRGGFISNPEGLATVITNALKKARLGGKRRVIASLPGFHTMCRILSLPPSREIRPQNALPQLARREMAFSPERSSLFWQRLPNGGARRRFLALSVPTESITVLVNTLKLARLRPWRIETKPFALARVVNQPDAIIAALESNSLDIVITRGAIPIVTQSTLLGEEARDTEALPPLLSSALMRITTSYNDSNPDEPLPTDMPLYLFGSSLSLNPDIASAAESALGYSVSEFNPPLLYPPDFPKGELATNMGLVLREL